MRAFSGMALSLWESSVPFCHCLPSAGDDFSFPMLFPHRSLLSPCVLIVLFMCSVHFNLLLIVLKMWFFLLLMVFKIRFYDVCF